MAYRWSQAFCARTADAVQQVGVFIDVEPMVRRGLLHGPCHSKAKPGEGIEGTHGQPHLHSRWIDDSFRESSKKSLISAGQLDLPKLQVLELPLRILLAMLAGGAVFLLHGLIT